MEKRVAPKEEVENYYEALRQFDLQKAIVAGFKYRNDVSEKDKIAFRGAIEETEAILISRAVELDRIKVQ